MRKRRTIYTLKRRFISSIILASFCIPNAAALSKEIEVWGAQSINNFSGSDMQTTIEMLKDDYEPFRTTSGLVEYFYTNKSDPVKSDLGEAYSWLIDNNILSRDETVLVNNVSLSTVPSISISKSTLDDLYQDVNRSDAIMYLYKAVFGPLWGRTVGFETANVRVNGEKYMTLDEMIVVNRGSTEISPEEVDTVTSGNGAVEVLNDSSNWRYSPQGTEYTSIFGDTNVFITQNDVNMEISGGDSTANGPADSVHSGNGGNVDGSNSQDLNYYADYKSIYYKSGADIWFYRTCDVVEMYLQAALSKGILDDEKHLRTKLFEDTFYHLTEDGTPVASWSGDAVPYVPNRTRTKVNKVINTEYAETSDVLGKNYSVSSTGNGYTINRLNLYSSDTGYFTTEKLYKIDIYKYIYRFLNANEKKLSDTEIDMVNYKVGMELDGVADSDDVDVLKYLVAKGVLDYEITDEFQDLDSPMPWYMFIELLYRVANPNARYDFSAIQLTDAETDWKAKGFAEQTLTVIEDGEFGEWSTDTADESWEIPSDGSNVIEIDKVGMRSVLDSIDTSEIDNGFKTVNLAANDMVSVKQKSTQALVGDYRYSIEYVGLTFVDALGDDRIIEKWFENMRKVLDADTTGVVSGAATTIMTRQKIMPSETYLNFENTDEPMAVIAIPVNMTLNNFHCVARIKSDESVQQRILAANNKALSRCKTDRAAAFFKAYQTQFNKLYGIKNTMSIRYYRVDGTTTQWATKNITKAYDFIAKTQKAQFYYIDSQGEKTTLMIQFKPDNSAEFNVPIGSTGIPNKAQALYTAEDESKFNIMIHLYYSDGDKVAAVSKLGRAVTLMSIFNAGRSSYIDSNGNIIIGQKSESINENASGTNVSGSGSDSVNEAEAEKLQAFVDPEGKDAFLSWDTIKNYNESVSDPALQIPITQVSDLLLYNSATDTYAYFSDQEGKKIALVGTAVVTGDSSLGVAFKSGTGESAKYYYHINAIRLLLDAKQELRVLSGVKGFELPDKIFANAVTTVPLVSESGYQEFGVSGVKAELTTNDATASAGLAADSPYFYLDAEQGGRYGEFLTLSQANRVMNVVTRRITYKVNNVMNGAYAVVVFEPVDVSTLGTQPVTGSMSMQDMLDSAAKPPTSAAGKSQWTKNKALCNAFANWIYGTTGQEYIGTGYLTPKAYLYIAPDSSKDVASGFFEPLTAEQQKMVNIVDLKDYSGHVSSIGMRVGSEGSGDGYVGMRPCNYWLSADYRILVNGDRVYMNVGAFKDIEPTTTNDGTYGYKLINASMSVTPFTIGGSFKMIDKETLSTGMPTPSITVIQTKSNGNIVCQVGPITGTPGKAHADLTGIIGVDSIKERPTDNFAVYVNNPEFDSLAVVRNEMLSGYTRLSVTSIVSDPFLTLNGARSGALALYNGKNISVYDDGNYKQPITTFKVKDPKTYSNAEEYAAAVTKAINSKGNVGIDSDDTEAYVQIEFPAYMYTVEEGKLKKSNAQASDYISPVLFTSLNDLIIDEMITSSNGAIKANEIPAGSILKIGTGYYTASGSSTSNKSFIGYSALDATANNTIYGVKLQDATKSFTNQYIRAGNQYVNVSHFFNAANVLGSEKTSAQVNALKIIADATLALDGATKFEMNADGDVSMITGSSSDVTGQKYAPVELKLSNLLLAYRVSAPESSVPRYELISFADENISGALDQLPFWTDNLLSATMFDQTTTFIESNYQALDIVDEIIKAFQENFQKAFQGDVITLLRLIIFIALCWLMVASWICFTFKLGGLSPILETIHSPTSTGRGNGIDLLKVISAGTITIDTEFTLGRFIQYELILTVLIYLVWKSGALFN